MHDPRGSRSVNGGAVPTSVPYPATDPMAVTRSQSSELRRQRQKQQVQQQQKPETVAVTNSEPDDVVEVLAGMETNELDLCGQAVVSESVSESSVMNRHGS